MSWSYFTQWVCWWAWLFWSRKTYHWRLLVRFGSKCWEPRWNSVTLKLWTTAFSTGDVLVGRGSGLALIQHFLLSSCSLQYLTTTEGVAELEMEFSCTEAAMPEGIVSIPLDLVTNQAACRVSPPVSSHTPFSFSSFTLFFVVAFLFLSYSSCGSLLLLSFSLFLLFLLFSITL